MPSNSRPSSKRPQRPSTSGRKPAGSPPAAAKSAGAPGDAVTSTTEDAVTTPSGTTPAADETPKPKTPAKATPGKKAPDGRTGGSGGGKGPGGRGPGGKGPAGKGSGGSRGRQPVKVKKAGLPWGNIALGGIVAVVALSIIGYGIWYSWDASKPFGERRAQQIDGLVNYRAKKVSWLTQNHVTGKVTYKTSPPVGGNHNATWESCDGQVYTQQIPNEHAVHALEHGAVWITYRPGLPQSQIDTLAKKVKGVNYMLMSPYPGLDKPISLQAWGLQLKLDNASDKRIDEFIKQFRINASVESGATCSNGVTVTGDTPTESSTTDPAMTTGTS